jgi:small subunit ribosomal protein S20
MRAIEAGNKDVAIAAYATATPIIDAMVNRGLLHRNKAARHKSRMNAHIKTLP